MRSERTRRGYAQEEGGNNGSVRSVFSVYVVVIGIGVVTGILIALTHG